MRSVGPSQLEDLAGWLDEVNILGTPLGSPDFETEYQSGKGLKHKLLLDLIKEVADAGF